MVLLSEMGLHSEEDAMNPWAKKLPARNSNWVTLSVDDLGIHLSLSAPSVRLTPNQASDVAAELLEANRQWENRG